MASRRKKNVLDLSRRGFLASTAAAAAASLGGCVSPQTRPGEGPSEKDVVTKKPQVSYSTGPVLKLPDRIRVGLIGCGGRGTGAAIDCANAEPNVEFVALGDLFQDRLDGSRKTLNEKVGARCKVTDGNCFTGFDAYKGVLNAPIDLVILATPPGFRPIHLKAAVEAKKHVFMEKPVAVDPIGARSVIDSAELASQQGLGIVAGTQRRHEASYIETMKRIHDGAIGKIVAAQCYWNQEGLWVNKKQPNWSDMEWQCRNWLYFSWLSGDHIVEQHVHNIDVINWALQATPVKCVGMGGRQWRTGPEYGNIWDHFAVEYEYPGGVRVLSMCRQTEKTSTRVSEHLVGEKGMANPNGSIEGRKAWKYEAPEKPVNPYVQEHADLIASIRAGKPLNEGVRIAESTLTAIMGRMSAYTGREIPWDWVRKASKLDLTPPKFEFGDLPVGEIPVPGVTQLV